MSLLLTVVDLGIDAFVEKIFHLFLWLPKQNAKRKAESESCQPGEKHILSSEHSSKINAFGPFEIIKRILYVLMRLSGLEPIKVRAQCQRTDDLPLDFSS